MPSGPTPIIAWVTAAVMLLNSIICFCGGTARVRGAARGAVANHCPAPEPQHRCPHHATHPRPGFTDKHQSDSPEHPLGHACPHCQQVLTKSPENTSADAAILSVFAGLIPAASILDGPGLIFDLSAAAPLGALPGSTLLRLHCALNL